ncbi:MAG: sulfur carrier protein ThiS [Tannerella sp.]|jgi:sulfur carrier protein|nr:sulfur carrier protein ThiS [Tannerella sp.]
MRIKLNDATYEPDEGVTLEKFIAGLGIPLTGIAVAIDYDVVPRDEWRKTILRDGMNLIMINAVSGG